MHRFDELKTTILAVFASITGVAGLNLTEIDLLLAIFLKLVSLVSVILICAINWAKGMDAIAKFLRIKKDGDNSKEN